MIVLRRIIKIGGGLLLLCVAAILGLIFWPGPSRPQLSCVSGEEQVCRIVQGRVVYALQGDRSDSRRPLHLVLLSRESVAFPGVTVVKIPVALRPRKVPGVGSWVAAAGREHRGSNGQTNVGVEALWVAP